MPKGEHEAAKTHCPQGHAYDESNTVVRGGSRYCLKCRYAKEAARSAVDKARRREGGRIVIPTGERTHCPRGHAYDEANTRISIVGGRQCRACDLAVQNARNNAHPERMMWKSAQTRARKKGLLFTITPDDIVIPTHCPVLGVLFERKATKGPGPHSPTLDRIVAANGYVPGNVVVISLRANRIKNDASLEDLERLTEWLRRTLQAQASAAE